MCCFELWVIVRNDLTRLTRGFCRSCAVSDVYAPQADCLKNPNCRANRPFWCRYLWHWDPQIGADMQTLAVKRMAALWMDFRTGLGLCLLVPNGPSKSKDGWLVRMLQTIIYFLMLQSFQSLSTFQSVICFCNDYRCEGVFKSLGLSCNQLALMKEERDQRNSSGFESETKTLLSNNVVQISERWRLRSCCEVRTETLQSELQVQAFRRWEKGQNQT